MGARRGISTRHSSHTPASCDGRKQARAFLESYSERSVKTLTAVCVTDLQTGRRQEGTHESTVFWRKISAEVVDAVMGRGNTMGSVRRRRVFPPPPPPCARKYYLVFINVEFSYRRGKSRHPPSSSRCTLYTSIYLTVKEAWRYIYAPRGKHTPHSLPRVQPHVQLPLGDK